MNLIRREDVKKALAATLVVTLAVLTIYIGVEPTLTHAGNGQVVVTLNVATGVSLSVDSNAIQMSNTIGVANNTAVATSTFTVITNDSLGYTMTVAASTSPAMKSGANFVADYSTTTAPSAWSVSANDARFGFSVFGTDVRIGTSYWGTGSFCNGAATSTVSTTLRYTGFYTTATTTSLNTSTTTQAGNTTTLCYAAQQGTSFYISSGTYVATITGTATAN